MIIIVLVRLRQSTRATTHTSYTRVNPSGQLPVGKLLVRGSIPYWDQKNAFKSLKDHYQELESVSVFWYFLDSDGKLTKYSDAVEDKSILEFAHQKNIRISAVLTNLPEAEGTSWNSSSVEKAISTFASRQELIESILQKLDKYKLDGITIDFEEVDRKVEQNYTLFIQQLAEKLDQQQKFLGVALHPKTGQSADRQYRFQNWTELSKYADELYIMAYGEHWDEGSPGPIASNEWVQSIINYAFDQKVPLAKFYLGIPLYGYDWNLDDEKAATGLIYTEVKDLMDTYTVDEEWGEDTPAPFFSYNNHGQTHEVWFENGPSVEEKIKLAKLAGFGGVTFWRLGGEDSEVWNRVRMLNNIKATTSGTANP